MMIVVLSIATALTASWLVLLGRATREDWIAAAYSRVLDNFSNISKKRLKESRMRISQRQFRGAAAVGVRILSGNPSKAIKKLESDSIRLQEGDLRSVSILIMPGYVLQREFEAIGKGGLHKEIMAKCHELCGKKHAAVKAKNLMAKLLSYPVIGLAATLMLGAVLLGIDFETYGTAILGVGTILVFVLVYSVYDELCDMVRKRRSAISKQFPNVVSKLALLVTSGMIMDRAWKETAYSQDAELYREMRKTAEELDNLVSPEVAYGDFINRCNTKETTRLASAIMQNLSKGNVEIGRLLKNMAREAWQERRHTAKRDAEKANTKLMIPTMLLFIAILVMIIVPLAMNFSTI